MQCSSGWEWEGFQKWLEFKWFLESPELSAETQRLLLTLKIQMKKQHLAIIWSLVYGLSKDGMGLEEGGLTLQEAVPLFGHLDHEQCLSQKNQETLGTTKPGSAFFICMKGALFL